MSYTLNAEPGHINFSPVGFRHVARDLLHCFDAFRPATFSVVPYFLCCRAIELGLKAMHLETASQQHVKNQFGHDLLASYNALPAHVQQLSSTDIDLLRLTNQLYVRKAFEYMSPGDAATGFSTFPDLQELRRLAERLIT